MKCSNCGIDNPSNTKFCPNCGMKQTGEVAPNQSMETVAYNTALKNEPPLSSPEPPKAHGNYAQPENPPGWNASAPMVIYPDISQAPTPAPTATASASHAPGGPASFPGYAAGAVPISNPPPYG